MPELISEDDVRKVVVVSLNKWQGRGAILNWERINCGRVQSYGKWFYGAKAGFPDYFAEVISDISIGDKKIIFNCYFETKRPSGGKWTDEQILFKASHEEFANTTYDLVSDPLLVDTRIDTISQWSVKKFKDMDKHMGIV